MTVATANGRRTREAPSPPTTVRVAVYTRKSTEDGLDQEFNSLDAQRAAVEGYVACHRAEGWKVLPTRYDDGGFTGANTDRPAFRRLLEDVEAHRVDVVAVYKIDRLSRSLHDFTTTMRTLEERGVRFVSVTQAFDTSTSMGRMTLNLLATFAQFEREMVSERTRDKIAATRRRGIWLGPAVLGYSKKDKHLVVDPGEAGLVREIFGLYLRLGSLLSVVDELRRRGARGRAGAKLDKSAVHRILTNPLYVGRVPYREETYPGAHEAIVDQPTWDAVQVRLRAQATDGGASVRNRHGALLRGLLRCGACGSGMATHYTAKRGRRYGYYVCERQIQEGAAACPGSRAPAGEIERFVLDRIREVGTDPRVVAEAVQAARDVAEAERARLAADVRRHEAEVRRLRGERTNLVNAVGRGRDTTGDLARRLAEVDEAVRGAQGRAAVAGRTLARLGADDVDGADVRAALSNFDAVWERLETRERERVLRLLVEQVTFDARAGQVAITFRPGGVRAVPAEAPA